MPALLIPLQKEVTCHLPHLSKEQYSYVIMLLLFFCYSWEEWFGVVSTCHLVNLLGLTSIINTHINSWTVLRRRRGGCCGFVSQCPTQVMCLKIYVLIFKLLFFFLHSCFFNTKIPAFCSVFDLIWLLSEELSIRGIDCIAYIYTSYPSEYIFKVYRTVVSMSCFSWLYTLWPSSCLSLLLIELVGRQLGLRVGLQVVQTVTCSQWGTTSNQGLFQDGDVVIGGLFNLHYHPPAIDHSFTQLPHYKPCIG